MYICTSPCAPHPRARPTRQHIRDIYGFTHPWALKRKKERQRTRYDRWHGSAPLFGFPAQGEECWRGREFAVSVLTYTEGESCGKTERLLSRGIQGRARYGNGDLELNRRPTIVREPAFWTSRGEWTWAVPLVDWSPYCAGLEALVALRESHQSSATIVAFLSCYLRRRTEKSRLPHLTLSLLFYPSPFPSLNRSLCVFVDTGEDTLISGSVEVAHVFIYSAARLLRRAIFYVDFIRYGVLSFQRVYDFVR